MEGQKESALLNKNPLFPFRITWQGLENQKIFSLPHWHEYMELIYATKGSIEIGVNGEEILLNEGDIAFLGEHTVHSSYKPEGQLGISFVLFFDSTLVSTINSNVLESKYIKSFLSAFGSKYNYHIIRNENSNTELCDILSGIYREFFGKKEAYELVIKGYLYQMIACLIRETCIKMIPDEFKEEHIEQVEKSLRYIEEHYSGDISLHKLAEECNISYHYFSKIFKKVTGKNYKEYIDFVRVNEAEKLMLEDNYSISEISYKVGIPDQSCFYRLYKRVRGCSPTEFKAKMKNA